MNEALISLRRAKPDDAPSLVALMTDEAVFGNLLQLPYPSEAVWRERLQAKSGNGDLQLVAIAQGQLIGSAGLHSNLHVRRRHAMSLGISRRRRRSERKAGAGPRPGRGQRVNGGLDGLCRSLGRGFTH